MVTRFAFLILGSVALFLAFSWAVPSGAASHTLSPAPNRVDVVPNTNISLTYNQAVDPAAVMSGIFAVHASQSGRVAGAYSASGGQVLFDPALPFKPGELVFTTATTGTFFLTGSGPITPTVWQFQVAPAGGSAAFSNSGRHLAAGLVYEAAVGDLDGDGDLDIVTVHSFNATQVWINDSGVFSRTQALASGVSHSVVLGDLDGDRDLDIFIVNKGTVPADRADQVWFNRGDGTFFNSGQALGDSFGNGVALGDLDGDGDLDAFVANYFWQQDYSRVWLNDGSGTFVDSGQNVGTPTTNRALAVALGDLDNDGDLDAIIGLEQSDGGPSTQIWINDGRATFHPGQIFGDAVSSRSVALGDLDGDGDLDAFIANFSGAGTPNRVWLNNGDGNFTDSGRLLGAARSWDVNLADLDADGDLDAFVANSEGYEVWINNGRGEFAITQSPAASGIYVALGDMDGDGDIDALLGNLGLSRSEIWENADSPTMPRKRSVSFQNSGQSLGADRSQAVELGDLDGDEDLDAYFVQSFSTINRSEEGSTIKWKTDLQPDRILLNTGNATGSFAPAGEWRGGWNLAAASGDLDGDGDRDLFVTGVFSDFVRINDGHGTFSTRQQIQSPTILVNRADLDIVTPEISFGVALGDLDGDGDLDAFLANGYRFIYPFYAGGFPTFEWDLPAPETIWFNDGSALFTDSGQRPGQDTFSLSVALGDLDGDGDLDAFVGNQEYDEVWFNAAGRQGGQRGRFINSGQRIQHYSTTAVALGDLDGDGDLDAFLAGSLGSEVWFNDGAGIFSNSGQRLGTGYDNAVVLGDLDLDGDLDAFIGRGDQQGQPNLIWLNGEFGLAQGYFIDSLLRLGNAVSKGVALGDLDGDGDLDALAANWDSSSEVWKNGSTLCCPVELIAYGQSSCNPASRQSVESLAATPRQSSEVDLAIIARLRDEFLRTSPAGRHFIGLYYTHTPEIVTALLAHPTLRTQAQSGLELWQPLIQALLDNGGQDVVISDAQIQALEALLSELAAVASPNLSSVIAQERATLPKLETFVGMSLAEARQQIFDTKLYLPSTTAR